MIKTLLVFLLIFIVIVTIHEFGHFYFARKAGILVREFAIGMGPKLFAKQGKDGVTYTVRMLPLGGYVRLAGLGEDSEVIQPGMQVSLSFNESNVVTQLNTTEHSDAQALPIQVDQVDLTHDMVIRGIPIGETEIRTFLVDKKARIIEPDGTSVSVAPYEVTYNAAKPLGKMMTNFAGPMNNFILSILTFIIVAFIAGGVPSSESYIGELSDDGAAMKAGLQTGDKVTQIGDEAISSWTDLVLAVQSKPGETVDFEVVRGQETLTIPVTIDAATNGENQVGRIGVMHYNENNFLKKITYGFTQTWAVIMAVVSTIFNMFKTGFNINHFGGPVAMAQMTNEVVQDGFLTSLSFLGLLSANLGAFNLLPIPALDGGKIVLNIAELLRGKPISQEKEGIITLIGALILITFMIAVTWNDISRLFS